LNRKIGGIIIAVIIVIIFISLFGVDFDERKTDDVFRVTLANPAMYENGVFVDSFEIDGGSYYFDFIPNGDSPKTLTIILQGIDSYFMEVFEIEGILHSTGISEYYTWKYNGDGDSGINIPYFQEVQITIDPNGNYNGPVSVILKKVP
jgi:hypothetical protein